MSPRGFTLLELLVVLAILGLALAIAVPRFSQAQPGLQIKSAARDLAAALRRARDKAIATNREIVFTLDPGIGRYRVDNRERNRIRFFPDGSTAGGRIALSIGSRTAIIAIDWLTGRVRVLPGSVENAQ